ncbi:hypothetical protein K431DRAFT_288665 [Polychaeton citri CBS 116435]|uniref:Uncharacterized protein n=1 Tax=Polychaeton citri CBS 116435 TaxID=1314669 RepID=A0A9P4UKB6_9PEZI|nr:hypothetical protein K431DRAFT_288665 [Polychaeton citri CBS 116435]
MISSDPVVLPDRILGFAFASPLPNTFPNGSHQEPAYCPRTAYLNFFTKSADSMKGVGSCLLDKLLDVLDKFYFPRGGYNVKGDEVNGVGIKIMRIKDLYIRFLHADDRKLPWITRWLQSEYVGFKKINLVEDVGTKNGQGIHEAIFHRETGEPFAAWELQ